MQPTDQTLLGQLKITEREIIKRLEYLQISEDDSKVLLEAKPLIAKNIDCIINEYYESLLKYSEVSRIIGDADSLSRLKKYVRQYVLDLFNGEYGEEYVHSRLRVGLVHKRIGVTPKLYIMAIRQLLNLLRKYLMDPSQKNCVNCHSRIDVVEKVIMFDLTLVFDTYIHSLVDELERGKEEIEKYADNLEEIITQKTKKLTEMARQDGLTSLSNQRSFYEELRKANSRSRRLGEDLSLIYLDLDGFKKVNDTFGHKKGDEILVKTSAAILTTVRAEDTPARYGGDEFCIILPNTSINQAHDFAKRLIEVFNKKSGDSGVTLSIGIATTNKDLLLDSDTLVKKADKAMYNSKKKSGHAINVS